MIKTRYNITDIHRDMNSRTIKKSESYEKILEMIYKRILKNGREDKLSYFFEVPEYIFGYPLFKLDVLIKFLYAELTKNGFLVKYYFPKYLYISWDYDEIKYENSLEKLPYQIPHYQRPELPFFKQPIALPIYDPENRWVPQDVNKNDQSNSDVQAKFLNRITDYNICAPEREKKVLINTSNTSTHQNLSNLPFLSSGMGKKKGKGDLKMKPGGKFELNLF